MSGLVLFFLLLFAGTTAAEEQAFPSVSSAPVSPVSVSIPQNKQIDKQIIERYRQILLRSPKRGVSFDKVFNSYSEADCIPLLLDNFAKLKTSAKTPAENAKAELLLGLVYERCKEYEKAAECFSRAAELDKSSPTAPFYLAENLTALKKYTEAETAMKTALQRNPNRTEILPVLHALVFVLDKLEKFDDAITVLQQALKFAPVNEPAESPELLELMSKRAEQHGDLPEAIQIQKKLCALYRPEKILSERTEAKKQVERLLTLYIRNGDKEKSYQLFFNTVLTAGSVSEQTAYIVKMLAAGQFQSAEKVLDFLEIHQNPDKRIDFCRFLLECCRQCSKHSGMSLQ